MSIAHMWLSLTVLRVRIMSLQVIYELCIKLINRGRKLLRMGEICRALLGVDCYIYYQSLPFVSIIKVVITINMKSSLLRLVSTQSMESSKRWKFALVLADSFPRGKWMRMGFVVWAVMWASCGVPYTLSLPTIFRKGPMVLFSFLTQHLDWQII